MSSSSGVEKLVAELRGQREEEQSQEEQAQHGSQQHHTVQLVVPPGQDTHRPHRAEQPRHAAAGTTANRDSEGFSAPDELKPATNYIATWRQQKPAVDTLTYCSH